MVIRLVMRQVLSRGMSAGINAVGNKMSGRKQAQGDGSDTQQQQQGGPDTGETTKRAKQAIRAGGRINKF